jgi:hypothetical protein
LPYWFEQSHLLGYAAAVVFHHTNFKCFQERGGRNLRFPPNYRSVNLPWNSPDQIFIRQRNIVVLQNFQGARNQRQNTTSHLSDVHSSGRWKEITPSGMHRQAAVVGRQVAIAGH